MSVGLYTVSGQPYADYLSSLELYHQASIWLCLTVVIVTVWLTLKKQQHNKERLLSCTSGIASLEFLMVLLPLLIIVLALIQISLMINAQLHVGYAAFAAGRSASTVIYEKTDAEDEGVLANASNEGSTKWVRIKRATVPALLPISPGRVKSAVKAYAAFEASAVVDGGSFGGISFDSVPESLLGQLGPMVMHRGGDFYTQLPTRAERGAVKALYADLATEVWINGRNADGELKEGGESAEAFDLSEADTLTVDVSYHLWLNVPYAGRTMKTAMDWEFAFLSPFLVPTTELSETVVVSAWRKRKAF